METPPLHFFIEQGNKEMSKYLVENGANINLLNNKRETPIYLAFQSGQFELFDILHDSKVDIEGNGRWDFIEYLIERQIEVTDKNESGQTLLHLAVGVKKDNIVKKLIDECKNKSSG